VVVTATSANQLGANYAASIAIQGPNNSISINADLNVYPVAGTTLSCGSGVTYIQIPGTEPQTSNNAVTLQPLGANITSVTPTTQTGGGRLSAQIYANYPSQAVMTVYASTANAAPGTYQGAVTVNSSNYGSCTVPVTLSVLGTPAPPQLTATSLIASAPAGQSVTASLTVSSTDPELISIGGNWSSSLVTSVGVQSSYSSNPYATPPSYVTPAAVSLTMAGQRPGAYFGILTVGWGGGTIDVPFALYVSASAMDPPIVASIVNSAALTPAALSPGELFTLTGVGLAGLPRHWRSPRPATWPPR
jgi:hypothetical protein